MRSCKAGRERMTTSLSGFRQRILGDDDTVGPQREKAMKLIRHGTEIVAVIQHGGEKAYLHSQRGKQEWVPMFLVGEARPFAEIHSATRQVHLCEGRELAAEQSVVFHDV